MIILLVTISCCYYFYSYYYKGDYFYWLRFLIIIIISLIYVYIITQEIVSWLMKFSGISSLLIVQAVTIHQHDYHPSNY
ncbi:hypothetical protein [Salmonella phage phA11]|uniref:Uncharacterized protein n=1 Tax=Salmonella phage phA11 TaxID=3038307 RepID=A0AAF0K0G3_9CAUD|nr:hypothetical protein [Salmonella phage phA11]